MPLPKSVQLAHAKRVLRRLQEDEANFLRRIAGCSPNAHAAAIALYEKSIKEALDRVSILQVPGTEFSSGAL